MQTVDKNKWYFCFDTNVDYSFLSTKKKAIKIMIIIKIATNNSKNNLPIIF